MILGDKLQRYEVLIKRATNGDKHCIRQLRELIKKDVDTLDKHVVLRVSKLILQRGIEVEAMKIRR